MGVKLHHRQVRKFLEEIVGKNGVDVLKACEKGVTDEVVMSETGLKLATIRSILNQLHYSGLIAYDREKDPNTNWYTYTWFARKDKIKEIIKDKWQERLAELEKKFDYESNYVFFECSNQCERLPFELAAEYDFKCPSCGASLQNIDNKKRVREVLTEIKELNSLMSQIRK